MERESITFAYFGSEGISIIVLEELLAAELLPTLIVAPPDRPKGRKMIVTAPEIKEWAIEHSIPYIQPKDLKDNLPLELTDFDWDVFIVVSYGKILSKELLALPLHGTLNVHPSLLPKFRGPSPIQSAIVTDAKETGVTLMLLDEKMDHGPILAQAKVTVEDWPPKVSMLAALLGQVGGELLVETLPEWLNGNIKPEEQDHERATFIKKIKKEDGLINLGEDAYKNLLKIRAYEKWPGTYFFVKRGGKNIRVKIIDAKVENNKLLITRIIPEGKPEMDYEDYIRKV